MFWPCRVVVAVVCRVLSTPRAKYRKTAECSTDSHRFCIGIFVVYGGDGGFV